MPGSASTIGILTFLGFVGLGISIFTVIRFWLVDATLEFGPAIALLAALLIGSTWAVKSASPAILLIWVFLMFGGGFGLSTMTAFLEKRAMHRFHEEDIAKYQRALGTNVQNAGAWREIGELYMKMNRYDEAIAAFQEAINLNPHDMQTIQRRLQRAVEYRAGMPRVATILCPQCHLETPKTKACIHCGHLLDTNFWQWFLQGQNFGEALKPMAAIGAGAVAVVTIFLPFAIAFKALLILICILIGGFFLWQIVLEE